METPRQTTGPRTMYDVFTRMSEDVSWGLEHELANSPLCAEFHNRYRKVTGMVTEHFMKAYVALHYLQREVRAACESITV